MESETLWRLKNDRGEKILMLWRIAGIICFLSTHYKTILQTIVDITYSLGKIFQK